MLFGKRCGVHGIAGFSDFAAGQKRDLAPPFPFDVAATPKWRLQSPAVAIERNELAGVAKKRLQKLALALLPFLRGRVLLRQHRVHEGIDDLSH